MDRFNSTVLPGNFIQFLELSRCFKIQLGGIALPVQQLR
jgi:hypothetical protein